MGQGRPARRGGHQRDRARYHSSGPSEYSRKTPGAVLLSTHRGVGANACAGRPGPSSRRAARPPHQARARATGAQADCSVEALCLTWRHTASGVAPSSKRCATENMLLRCHAVQYRGVLPRQGTSAEQRLGLLEETARISAGGPREAVLSAPAVPQLSYAGREARAPARGAPAVRGSGARRLAPRSTRHRRRVAVSS